MTAPPLMKCGCAGEATDGEGHPVCLIHVGILPGARVVDDNPPSLAGRRARCGYLKGSGPCASHSNGGRCECARFSHNQVGEDGSVPSVTSLPFFKHQPGKPFDEFYCGCWGWD